MDGGNSGPVYPLRWRFPCPYPLHPSPVKSPSSRAVPAASAPPSFAGWRRAPASPYLRQLGGQVPGPAAELEGAGASILALHADSADAAALVAAVDEAAARFGRIDILVNNAAVLALGSVEELPLADFERTLAINVRSVFVATQAAVKHMATAGG